MKNRLTGATVPNQYTIRDGRKVSYQSYSSLIATLDGDVLTLGRDWDRSATTRKWLYRWMQDNTPRIWWELEHQAGDVMSQKIQQLIDWGIIQYNADMV